MNKIIKLTEKALDIMQLPGFEITQEMNDAFAEVSNALAERHRLERTPITEEWLTEHGFVRNEYRDYEYDLTIDEGRTEIRYYRRGGEPTSTMSVYKNIDFEDEVCYELPEPYFAAQMLDALELCNIKID